MLVERVWRSVKYECVYFKAYESVSQALSDIACHIDWYNSQRGHSSRDCKTPEQVWLAGLPALVSEIKEAA